MNNLSFHTSKPSGKLFSGLYRPLVMAASFAESDGHAYETSFHLNFCSNFVAKPICTQIANSNTELTLKHIIFESNQSEVKKKKIKWFVTNNHYVIPRR